MRLQEHFDTQDLLDSIQTVHEVMHLGGFLAFAPDAEGPSRIEKSEDGIHWTACPPGYQTATPVAKWGCLVGGVIGAAGYRETLFEGAEVTDPLLMYRKGLACPVTSDRDAREILGSPIHKGGHPFVIAMWRTGVRLAQDPDLVARVMALGHLVRDQGSVEVPVALLKDILSMTKVKELEAA